MFAWLNSGPPPTAEIFPVIREGDLNRLKELAAKQRGARLAPEGWSPLHLAARQGKLEMAQALLDAGADLEARDDLGRTPLFMAAMGTLEVGPIGSQPAQEAHANHVTMAEFLCGRGAQVDVRANNGQTPLQMACVWGVTGIVEMLLERGAFLDNRADTERTPFLEAAGHGRIPVLRLLAQHGANRDARAFGRTAVDLALEGRHQEAARELVRMGVESGSDHAMVKKWKDELAGNQRKRTAAPIRVLTEGAGEVERWLFEIETLLETGLPEDYRTYHREVHGTEAEPHGFVDHIYSSDETLRQLRAMCKDLAFERDYVPVADDGLGNEYLLKVEGADRGFVYYSNHESDVDFELKFASFGEFLAKLREADEEC